MESKDSKVKVTLYYAQWCGHCKRFLPEWNKLKALLASQNNKINDYDVVLADYEESANPDIMNKENIQGYPTIKIEFNNKKTDYEGERTTDKLVEHIKNLGSQNGGGENNKKYYKKYMKYKNKYMQLLKLKNKLK